jgi:predicted RecB family nuclease
MAHVAQGCAPRVPAYPGGGSNRTRWRGLTRGSTQRPTKSLVKLSDRHLLPGAAMFAENGGLRFSATDVSNHLGCLHRTQLDRLAAEGKLKRLFRGDPSIEALRERGLGHERAYLDALRSRGLQVENLAGLKGHDRYQATRQALERGVQVVAQGALENGRWMGYPDVLMRIEEPSALGAWSYEAIDTKLAQETKAGAVLQLCLYSELLEKVQGRPPTYLSIVPPGNGFREQKYRVDSFAAYFRWVRKRLEASVDVPVATYPEPVQLCDVCDWWSQCDRRRRDDDHLSLVAGISKLQRVDLESKGIHTLAALSELPIPLPFRPGRGSAAALERVRDQARLQRVSRTLPVPRYELLEGDQERGCARLPEPTPHDLFLDLEGSLFAVQGGQEYLFGLSGPGGYRAWWAADEREERAAFEQVMGMLADAWRAHPNLHVFHYNHYEVTAFKRLACKYGTCESALDQLLRGKVFVDLYPIVKNAVRAGVESYSIKCLEPLYGFNRRADLQLSSKRRHALEAALELGRFEDVKAEDRALVQAYNQDDCESAQGLRDWLEGRRTEFEQTRGVTLRRPKEKLIAADEDTEPEELKRRREELRRGVPENVRERSPEQQGRWLLSELLCWFWREKKARCWERYRLLEIPPADLEDEPRALSGLTLVQARVAGTKGCPVDRYSFLVQDVHIEPRDELFLPDAEDSWGRELGEVVGIDVEQGTIDVKKKKATANEHPTCALAWKDIPDKPLPAAIGRLVDAVIASGLEEPGALAAARELLLGAPPRFEGAFQLPEKQAGADCAVPAVLALERGVLAIQGPPGSGKSTTAGEMICALVKAGKRVGVTGPSHQVVHNLLKIAVEYAEKTDLRLRCLQKTRDEDDGNSVELGEHGIATTTKNEKVDEAFGQGLVDVVGGTAWLWAREEMLESVDVLFVDEAGQLWLAYAVAAAQAGKSVVLLGDPQQLDQVQQGTHPEGVAVSVLRHMMGNDPETGEPRNTLAPGRGLFLAQTHRLAPAIVRFTSEIFYDGLLASSAPAAARTLEGGEFAGTGLRFVPVRHEGDKNASRAEAEVVARLVRSLLGGSTRFRDGQREARLLEPTDVLIVAPYNAQVREIREHLGGIGVRIGTVDKFQGQQAPVVIYSLTTSRPEDAPRGMEFLYSPNRLNVATSRAQCVSILVTNPALLEPDCRSPRQIQLVNAFCRYRELARSLVLPTSTFREDENTIGDSHCANM